jgi:hypothetical protein
MNDDDADDIVAAATQAIQALNGEYAPLTRMQCMVLALLSIHVAPAALFPAGATRVRRIEAMRQTAAQALAHARAKRG